jgi:hypothetical protein
MNFQQPPFQSLEFIPKGEKEKMMNLDVLCVYAVAHSKLDEGGNHWCFYLDVEDSHSVCIDMTPSYTVPSITVPGGSKIIMLMSLLPYIYLPSSEKAVRLDVPAGIKVHNFVNLLVQRKRHQYEFNKDSQGCRFWTDDQLTLFQTSGLVVNPSQVTEARNAILTQYPDQVRYPLVVGSYYP